MKKLAVNSLKVGMSFTEPVYIEGESLFIPAGIPIKEKDLLRLSSWDVDTVYTDGNITTESGKKSDISGDKKTNIHSLSEVQENTDTYRSYIDLIEKVDLIFSNIASGIPIEVRSIDNIAAKMVNAVKEQHNQIIGFILGGEVSGFELAKSSVNSAILSTMIALEMKLSNHKIMQISTGALLHDIGMLRLPKDILEKEGNLTDAEIQRMQAHPLHTHKIICKEFLYPEEVGLVALQHHERWNGDGYPKRIAGAEIDIGARILSVADAFEAMVSKKSYRNSMIGYQAMKNLLSDNSRRFDPDVLKSFIRIMGIYPIGSIILLNNKAIARVAEIHKDAPLRPLIRMLIDENGKAYEKDEGALIDLLSEKSLFIARALDPKEISQKK